MTSFRVRKVVLQWEEGAFFTAMIFSAFKGRFLEFRRYHNFANLFSKLSESTFYKEISISVKSVELIVLD